MQNPLVHRSTILEGSLTWNGLWVPDLFQGTRTLEPGPMCHVTICRICGGTLGPGPWGRSLTLCYVRITLSYFNGPQESLRPLELRPGGTSFLASRMDKQISGEGWISILLVIFFIKHLILICRIIYSLFFILYSLFIIIYYYLIGSFLQVYSSAAKDPDQEITHSTLLFRQTLDKRLVAR